jgi:hypothetical protein
MFSYILKHIIDLDTAYQSFVLTGGVENQEEMSRMWIKSCKIISKQKYRWKTKMDSKSLALYQM